MFQHFNRTLFGGQLPDVLLNFSRKANSAGFFAPGRWARRDGEGDTAHEISINPDTLTAYEPKQVASTLVHEMAHLWQEEHGTPSRRGYHNREWAEKMEEVGLVPTDTGEPGGHKTGQRMTHYIAPGGRFEVAFEAMAEKHLLPWRADGRAAKKRQDPSKAKYTCPGCGVSVWGKLGVRVGCLDCKVPLVAA
jgi:hypothetical protein